MTFVERTSRPLALNGPSLEALFVAHGGYVGTTLLRLGVAFDDVEDVLHEVFLQVERHLGDYDPSRPARPWLFAFAFRVAALHRRRAHRSREVLRPGFEPVDPSPRADDSLAAAEDRMLVREALQSVALERRAVFVLYEIDGVPMREIAQTLSIPVNTSYSRLRLARKEFAEAVTKLRLRRDHR